MIRIRLSLLVVVAASLPLQAQISFGDCDSALGRANTLVQQKNYVEAHMELDRLRKSLYESRNWRCFVLANYLKALNFENNSQHDMALSLLESTADLIQTKTDQCNDVLSQTYQLLATIHFSSRSNASRALHYYQKAFSLNPSDSSLLLDMGHMMAENKEFEKAFHLYYDLMASYPSPGILHRHLARAHYIHESLDSCIFHSEMALSYDSLDLQSRYRIALCNLRKGDSEAGRLGYSTAKIINDKWGLEIPKEAISELTSLLTGTSGKVAEDILNNVFNKPGFVAYTDPPQLIGGYGFIKKHLKYPESARKKGLEGKIMIKAILSEKGEVLDAQILKEDPPGEGFGQAGLDIIYKCKFKPAKNEGKPVKVSITIPLTFRLKG